MFNNQYYYDILGISKNATNEQIKSAFRKLALKWHPDRNKSPEANDIFKSINEANGILSNPIKRMDYNAYLDKVTSYKQQNFKQKAAYTTTSNQSQENKTSAKTKTSENNNTTKKNKSWPSGTWVAIIFIVYVLSSIFQQNKTSNVGTTRDSINKIPINTPIPTRIPIIISPRPILDENVITQPMVPTKTIIDCTGPDGKHLFITQKECDDFNNAWKKPTPTSQLNYYDQGQSNQFNNCGSCVENSHCSYGSCACNDGYTKNYNNGQCEKCPDNSTGQYGSCTCNSGYSKNYSTGQCVKLNCPSNSHESGNSCICDNNYVMNYSNGQCEKCPDNSNYNYGSCSCNDGYAKNYSNGQCEKLNCPSNSHVSNNSCVCNDNYVKNYSNGQCEPCPSNSTWSYGYCSCNSGYVKNYSTGQCDKQ